MSSPQQLPIPEPLRARIASIRLAVFDFDGVFTNNMVYVFEDGREAVRCCRSDGIGLRKIERAGIETLVLSTETNPVVSERCRKLKIRCIQACEDKLAALGSVIQDRGLDWGQVAFVGNDVNDLPCLERVGLPIVVQDAHRDVVPHAQYQTRAVGGAGAVREICDLFEQALATQE